MVRIARIIAPESFFEISTRKNKFWALWGQKLGWHPPAGASWTLSNRPKSQKMPFCQRIKLLIGCTNLYKFSIENVAFEISNPMVISKNMCRLVLDFIFGLQIECLKMVKIWSVLDFWADKTAIPLHRFSWILYRNRSILCALFDDRHKKYVPIIFGSFFWA